MLAGPIREFCNKNNYELIENYSVLTFLGEMVTTLAFVVKPDHNFFDALEQLPSFLKSKVEAKEIGDLDLEELEGTNVDYIQTQLMRMRSYIFHL